MLSHTSFAPLFTAVRPTFGSRRNEKGVTKQIRDIKELVVGRRVVFCQRRGALIQRRVGEICSRPRRGTPRGQLFVLVSFDPGTKDVTLARVYLGDWSVAPTLGGLWKNNCCWIESK